MLCSEQRQGGRLRDGRGQGETRVRFKGSRAGSSGEGIPAISPVISGAAVARRGKGRGERVLTCGASMSVEGHTRATEIVRS